MGEACVESAGPWWWFVLLLASAIGAFALFVASIGLWTGVLPSDRTMEEPPGDGWRAWFGEHAAGAFAAVLLLTFVVGAARRGDWQMVGVGVGAVMAALALGRVVGRVVEGPLEGLSQVVELRFDAMAGARPLTPVERARVARARALTGAALAVCVVTFVVMLGLSGGSMAEAPCPV